MEKTKISLPLSIYIRPSLASHPAMRYAALLASNASAGVLETAASSPGKVTIRNA